MTALASVRSALHPHDILRIATVGLRTRRLRAYLSALGIAIGIAAMVAVLGISESSRADLLSTLDRLGTNLLTAQAAGGFANRDDAAFPATAEAMLGRIGPVQTVASVTSVDAIVLRNDLVSEDRTGGLSVTAADLHLLDALGGQVADGEWLDPARSDLPAVVLGAASLAEVAAATGLDPRDVAVAVRRLIAGGLVGTGEGGRLTPHQEAFKEAVRQAGPAGGRGRDRRGGGPGWPRRGGGRGAGGRGGGCAVGRSPGRGAPVSVSQPRARGGRPGRSRRRGSRRWDSGRALLRPATRLSGSSPPWRSFCSKWTPARFLRTSSSEVSCAFTSSASPARA